MSLPAFRSGQGAGPADAALRRCIATADHAQQHAVLWFGDIMRRGLYRELGYSSMRAYALDRLGFSATRAGDFIRLARRLENLPLVQQKVASGEIGYTKAREITAVADRANERAWVRVAQEKSRRDLTAAVKRARAEARAGRRGDSHQPALLPAPPAIGPAAAPTPHRVTFELTPDQYARYEALLAKIGHRGDRAALLLEMVAALAAEVQSAPRGASGAAAVNAPRGASAVVDPHYQIHVHECPDCGRSTVATPTGAATLDPAAAAAARCDARIHRPGAPNTATIPPRIRREVLVRDHHRCRRRGCGHTRHLHLHHLRPRAAGGGNDPDNLVTLCAACHLLWHEKGGDLSLLLGAPGEEIPG